MKIEELQRIAAAATPGPREPVMLTHRAEDYGLHIDVTTAVPGACEEDGNPEGDVRFYATFNPELVARLLAVVEAAGDRTLMWNEEYCDGADYTLLCAARQKLESALAALEAAP